MPDIQEVHLELRHVLDHLDAAADDEARADCLAQLVAVLPGHFASEERPDGFLDRLVGHGSREQVDGLRRQHDRFREELQALEGLPHDEAWRDRLVKLAAALRRHEWEESRLAASPGAFDPEHDPFRGWD